MRQFFRGLAVLLVMLPLFLLSYADAAPRAAWRAGLAAVSITPTRSIWMAGYAARTGPSEGALHELYVKALALEDRDGRRSVLVSADLLGFPAELSRRIARRARERFRLPRERLVLNASHTHGGPVVGDTLRVAYQGLTPEQWAEVREYTRGLEDRVVECIGKALDDLRPARLAFGRGTAGFAANRRTRINPNGPIDHDVPVLKVEGERGELRGVVFGYACHCTTLGAEMRQLHGDYAGWAQARLEAQHPGARALFVTGCGADANPDPRGKLEMAREYGESLAAAVSGVLKGPLRPVEGPLRCAYEEVEVDFAPPPSREEWQKKAQDPNVYVRSHAQAMLARLDRDGELPRRYPNPVQVWRFGDDLTFVALAGEVVVDYALRLKKELGPERLWVSGYNNDVYAYIPSLRVLREGGYEGGEAMIYYGQPGPFAESVEETLVAAVHRLVKQTEGKR
ncbi:MAG: neutral/alkaline non-lysosomal ceramidase N-terminal domain-containing protein [Armatimonadota bacterium]